MGIVNVTPDSFSDGGAFLEPAVAIDHGLRLIDEGADLLDIGGESTRPGAEPVPPQEQCRRILPVLDGLRRSGARVPLFVDTRSAAVARAALDAGADGINDISALRDDPAMSELVAERSCPVILMHMKGTPATMQLAPAYGDVVAEVVAFLQERVEYAVARGIASDRIAIDPGIGFGKTTDHNLALLKRTDALVSTGRPVVVGPSRKRFIGDLLGIGRPADRDIGTLGAVAAAVAGGAAVVRVHAVAMARQVVVVCAAIRKGRA